MIVVYTGNGEGKTSACIGHMIRAIGYGGKAIMLQFIKGPWQSGEHAFEKKWNKKGFKIVRGGKGFVKILGDTIPMSLHKKFAQDMLLRAKKEIMSGAWDVVALDEVLVAIGLKLVRVDQVLSILKNVPERTDVILSGRGTHRKIIQRADLVTEMKEIKHPFQKGIQAKKGFDY